MKHVCLLLVCAISTIIFSISDVEAQEYLEFLNDENLTYQEIVDLAEQHFDEKGRGKHTGYKLFLRWKYFAERRLDDQGKVITENRAVDAYKEFLKQNPESQNRSQLGTWTEMGPLSAINTDTWSSHIGRITNIGIDPNNDQHIIVTSPGGGVWKTTDEGMTWTPIFDDESSMSAYAAMVSSADADHYLIATSGNGIRKSIDGGATWTSVNGENGTIYTFKQHPTNAQIILACSSNGNIYRSTDAGSNWSEIQVTGSTLYDIEFKPTDPDIVYTSGRSGNLWKSTDNGLNWSSVTGPWANRSLMMAVTPQGPSYLYVLQEQGGGFGALFLSRDEGNTWETLSDNSAGDNNIMGYNLNQGGGQAPRDMDLVVSPIDTTEIHVAGIMTFKSTDLGANWDQTTHWVLSNPLPFVHADIDQVIYHGSKIYVASDGGFFFSNDGAASFIDRTQGLGTRQFYRIGASSTEVGRVAGGSQDNGTGVVKGGIWYDFMGADGMEPIILNEDEDIIVGSIQYGSLYRSTNGGVTASGLSEATSANGSWVTPLEKDPIMKSTIYQAKTDVYRSDAIGSGWETISNGIGSGNADELCLAPSDNNIIYVAYGSSLYRTLDAGASWGEVTPANAETINYIHINPNNANHILLARSGSEKVVESLDGGMTWNDISFNLPSLGANSAVFDGTTNNGIYVAMTKGVYYKDNASPNSWTLMDSGLPNVNVTELEVIGTKLYAATYGRGLWEMDIAGNACVLRPNVERTKDDQGNEDPDDDTFIFSIDPGGIGLSGTYSVTGDVTASNVSFGSPYTFDNGGAGFLDTAGSISLTITPDNGSQNCPLSFKVNPRIKIPIFGPFFCDSAIVLGRAGVFSAPGPNQGQGATNNNRNANWYKFRAPANGLFTIFSCGSGEDTNLYIYSGDCDNKELVASVDDNCSMGPGQNNYASIIENLEMAQGQEYLIEWDSRWSSDPFDFTIEFVEDCPDELFLYTEGLDNLSFEAHQKITLFGPVEDSIFLNSPGDIVISDTLNVIPPGHFVSTNAPCLYSNGYNWAVFGGTNEPISDNNTIEIDLEIPAEFTTAVQDFDVYIDLEHTYVGDLVIEIVNPDEKTKVIWNRYCGGENDLKFLLDEEALDKPICGEEWRSGGHVHRPGLVPTTALSDWNIALSSGIWKIRISDLAGGDQGIVNQVGIIFK